MIGRRAKASTTAALAMAALALGLAGCMTPSTRLASPAPRPACAYAACGADALSLAKVTAADLQTAPDAVAIGAIQPQFNGAVLVWQAHVKGRAYLCREGRDVGDAGVVHYVDCRRTRETTPEPPSLKAFPSS